jgi:hypothetical protein
LEIISDRDKLFVSHFWKALNVLSGVKLKMSSSYHPQTDGSSEWTNKTINQALHYHMQRNQRGWVRALPKVRFDIMNTLNALTGYTGFQLRFGRSLQVIPPLVPDRLPVEMKGTNKVKRAEELIEQMKLDVEDARDNLLQAKVFQVHYTNEHRGKEEVFAIRDKVMLTTLHQRAEYKKKGEKKGG